MSGPSRTERPGPGAPRSRRRAPRLLLLALAGALAWPLSAGAQISGNLGIGTVTAISLQCVNLATLLTKDDIKTEGVIGSGRFNLDELETGSTCQPSSVQAHSRAFGDPATTRLGALSVVENPSREYIRNADPTPPLADAHAEVAGVVYLQADPGFPGPYVITPRLVITGTREGEIDCGLESGIAPLPGTPCTDAVVVVPYFADALPGRTVIVYGSKKPEYRPNEFIPLGNGRTTIVGRLLLPGAEGLIPFAVGYAMRTEVRISGKAAFHNTATLYLELPEGLSVVSGLGGLGDERTDLVLRAGQAVPIAEGTLTISPASGTLLLAQAFDLAVVAQTGGQPIAGVAATLDGVDVSAPLGACFRPGHLTGGTPGTVLTCPGVTGGILGAGTRRLKISVSLGDGSVLSDEVTWEVR